MNEGVDVENLLLRMAAREKVLFDQSASLMARVVQNEDALAIVRCIKFVTKRGEAFPIEIAVVSGKLSEPSWTYSSLIRANEALISEVGKIESGVDPIPYEILSNAKDQDSVTNEIRALMNDSSVSLVTMNQADLISKAFGINVSEYKPENESEKESMNSIVSRFVSTGRALPDAMFLYRAIKVARSRKNK